MSYTPYNWRNDKSTPHQREELERVARARRIHYAELVRKCCELIGRTIRDTGELTKGEASDLITQLNDEDRR